MGWFDEQLRQRARYDQEEFEESMLHMASSLIGGRQRDTRDVTAVTLDAVNAILKYYKCKSVEVPDTIEGPERQMEYCLRRHGIMSREVVLGEKWWKEAAGPMILYRKEGRIPAVAIPGTLGGYNIYENGSKLKADAKTFSEYEKKAVCFYDPLPQGSLGIKDLFAYMRKCLDKSDLIFVIILTLLITIAGMLLPRMTMVLTSVVSASKDSVFLAGTGVYMLSALIASTLISVTRTLMMSRLGSKMSLGVESAVMMRVINLPADFFRKYNSGELYSRVNSVGTLCNLLMGTVLTTLLTSISSLLYIRQIASFAPALLIPSVLILITTSVITVVTAMAQRRVNESVMQNQAKETGLTLGLISGVQKIRLTGSEKRAFSKWVRAYSKTASDMYDPPLFLKISGAVITGVGLVGTIILYFTAAVNNISPSEYISFNQSYGAVMGAFTAVSAIAT
ncbi:MAG: ABC transporter transmembrane domain-containing protein, partial [Lachnospiraceae bacterium]|nr:ABC transporter transmembrane domain-containing protein [Lachnospiraceae bacterium]